MLFLVMLPSLVTMLTVTSQSCISSTPGLVLLHHAYMSFKTSDPLKCYHQCTSDIKCQSINYYQTTQTCEMNNRTAGARPQYVCVDESAVYLDNPYRGIFWVEFGGDGTKKINRRYHGNIAFDDPNMGCFCAPTWVVYLHTKFQAPIGSAREVPAESCDEIRDIYGPDNGSVTHWVTEHGDPKQVLCFVSGMLDQEIACSFYTNITDATRNVKYGNPVQTDKCDREIRLGWYRLSGAAGVRMPTKCVPTQRCNTDAAGWLMDPHPSIEQGMIARKVCFHWNNNCCYWHRYIEVRNCGRFFIYQFGPTPTCELRYCGED